MHNIWCGYVLCAHKIYNIKQTISAIKKSTNAVVV